MSAIRRDRDDVLAAAFGLLDEQGLDALTLRAVARRLGAHLNTVSFQVKTKAGLLDFMADRILSELSLDGLPDDPLERAEEIVARYRAALLRHRDGARLVAGTSVFYRSTLTIGEAIIEALVAAGLAERAVVHAFWGVSYFTLGLVQEEQDASPDAAARLRAAIDSGEYPAIAQVSGALADGGFEERFRFGVRALLRAARPVH